MNDCCGYLTSEVHAIVDHVATRDPDRAAVQLHKLVSECGSAPVSEALIDLSASAIHTVRAGIAEPPTSEPDATLD